MQWVHFALLALQAAGLLVSVSCSATPTNADVIVIGAGMAGVTAARTLVDDYNATVIVLEARNRIGGRLYAVNTTYAGYVDTGAMWIHEATPENPLYQLAEEQGEPLSRLVDYLSLKVFSTDGKVVPNDLFLRAYLEQSNLKNSITRFQNEAKSDSSIQDESIYDMYQSFLTDNAIPENQVPMNNLLVNVDFQVLLNGNLTDLSSLRYGDAKTLPALDVFLYNGFDSLVKNMEPGLDIRLETPVEKVVQGEDGVTVVTKDGDEFKASYVLSTQSLGCLKSGYVEYDPPLPETKLRAIEDMGMGTFDKAILIFNQSYWDQADFIMQEMETLSGKWKVFLDYYGVMEKPALIALNVAQTAQGLEQMTNAEIKESLLAALRVLYPDLPDPEEFYATRWYEDPWSRGSYSYYAVGNEGNITAYIAEPVERFLFAGEAASDKPGTVLGAYLSGKREAERISKLQAMSRDDSEEEKGIVSEQQRVTDDAGEDAETTFASPSTSETGSSVSPSSVLVSFSFAVFLPVLLTLTL